MKGYGWIVERLRLSYGEVRQVDGDVLYYHKSGVVSKINVDINKLSKAAAEIEEQTMNNNGIPRKRRIYKSK